MEWIHQPDVFRRIADSQVPMTFIAAEHDIRPPWPLRQLAALARHGVFATVPGVLHDFWSTDPQVWVEVISKACQSPWPTSGSKVVP